MQVLQVSDDFKLSYVDPARILQLAEKLKEFDLATLREGPFYHRVTQQYKIAFEDRERAQNRLNVTEEELQALQSHFKGQSGAQNQILSGKLERAMRKIDDVNLCRAYA